MICSTIGICIGRRRKALMHRCVLHLTCHWSLTWNFVKLPTHESLKGCPRTRTLRASGWCDLISSSHGKTGLNARNARNMQIYHYINWFISDLSLLAQSSAVRHWLLQLLQVQELFRIKDGMQVREAESIASYACAMLSYESCVLLGISANPPGRKRISCVRGFVKDAKDPNLLGWVKRSWWIMMVCWFKCNEGRQHFQKCRTMSRKRQSWPLHSSYTRGHQCRRGRRSRKGFCVHNFGSTSVRQVRVEPQALSEVRKFWSQNNSGIKEIVRGCTRSSGTKVCNIFFCMLMCIYI